MNSMPAWFPWPRWHPCIRCMRPGRGIEGEVQVQFLVTAQGTVQDIEILAAEPEKVFEKSVIDCVSRWRFQPGRVQGIPVAALAQTTIRFQLE